MFFPYGGMDKVWGGPGDDTIVISSGKGYVKVMDMHIGDKIEYCGCASTVIEMKGDDARISNGSDLYAFVKGVDADKLKLDFVNREITMISNFLV